MKKLILISSIVILLVSLVLVSCGKEAAPTADTQTEPKVLKIGFTADFKATYGLATKNWMNLFGKRINDKGGWKIGNDIYNVQMIGYDDGFDPVKATSAAQRLVFQDQVKYIICPFGSQVLNSIIKITEPEKVLVVGGAASDEACKPEYKYVYKGAALLFTQGHNAILYKNCKDKGATSVVNLQMDNEAGRFMVSWKVRLEESIGLKVLDNMYWAMGTVDFMPLATKIANLKPDLVFFSGSTRANEWVQFLSDLLQTGYKGQFCQDTMTIDSLPLIIQKIGVDAVDKLELTSYIIDPRAYQEDPEIVALCDAYEKEYGEWYPTQDAIIINSWFIFKDAVNQTQSLDVDVITNYLSNNPKPVMSLLGWSQMFARPDVENYRTVDSACEMMLSIAKGGKLVPYKKVTVKDQYLSTITALGMTDVYQEYWDEYGYPKFAGE